MLYLLIGERTEYWPGYGDNPLQKEFIDEYIGVFTSLENLENFVNSCEEPVKKSSRRYKRVTYRNDSPLANCDDCRIEEVEELD